MSETLKKQCDDCIHNNVCIYKEHYQEELAKMTETILLTAKYPLFKCTIECIEYFKDIKAIKWEPVTVVPMNDLEIRSTNNGDITVQ